MQPDEGKWGSELAQERQQMQVRKAGCKDERQRLVDVRFRRRPGGRQFAPGEDVGSECKLRGLQIGTAMDGD